MLRIFSVMQTFGNEIMNMQILYFIVVMVWGMAAFLAAVRLFAAIFYKRVRNQIFKHPIIHLIWFGIVVYGIMTSFRMDLWFNVPLTNSPNHAVDNISKGSNTSL